MNLMKKRTPELHSASIRTTHAISIVIATLWLTGCGSVTVHHVPKVAAISPKKMSDLHGTPPVDIKAGQSGTEETTIGSVGMGKVVGKMSDWNAIAVEAARANLSARGVTITADAPKALTITMTKAEVKGIPFVGGAKSRIALTATSPDGLNQTVEASNGSLAPLGAISGAIEDAVKKLVTDPTVEAYLRK